MGFNRSRQAVEEFDDVGRAPGFGIIGVAGGEDVLSVTLEKYDVAIFWLQIRAHVGIHEPAAGEVPARGRPLRVDRAPYARTDVDTFAPWLLLELGYAHDRAAFRA